MSSTDIGGFPFYLDWTQKTTTVVNHDFVANTSNTTVHTYTPGSDGSPVNYLPVIGADALVAKMSEYPAIESSTVTKDASGNILHQTNKQWMDSEHPSVVQDVLDNGLTSEIDYGYETVVLPRIIEQDVYDYGAGSRGALLKKTVTNYQAFANTPIYPMNTLPQPFGPSLLSFPSSIIMYDGSNTRLAETDYFYDQSGLTNATAVQHDNTNYGSGSTAPRANLTSVVRKCFPNCSDATTTLTYDTTGQVVSMKDPNGQSTGATYTFSYADQFSPGTGQPSGQTNAFLTHIVSPTVNGVSASASATYGYNDGLIRSLTDANRQITTFCYQVGGCAGTSRDPWNRLTERHSPDGGDTTATYVDTGSNPTTSIATALNLSTAKVDVTKFDGFDHPIQVQSTSDPSGTDYIDTSFNGEGRTQTQSTPYRSTSESTYGLTTSSYDPLGRVVQKLLRGGSPQTWSYTGNTVTFTDENGNQWQRTSNALGQLTHVIEPGALKTDYAYDGLGNLKCVDQWGTASPGAACSSSRLRSFNYDSLSHLITSSNPETGTICYGTWSGSNCINGYDANGNLQSKTDARGVITHYGYDALNRLTLKTYSDGTHNAAFGYDGKDESGNTLAVTNAIGRLSHTSNQVNAAANYSYDAMGRITNQTYCIPSDCSYGKQVSAGYDLAGNQTSMTYPDGRVVQQGFDAAGRMSSVNYQSWNGTAVNQTYLTATASNSYDPAGHLVNASFGNNVALGAGYDNRQRMQTLMYGPSSAPFWYRQYGYTPNSNLQSDTDLITGVQRQFGYDSLNRLTAAQDIFSNLAVPSGSNNNTGSTSSSGSAATVTPGATGAVPWLTNPDDSNLLSEIGTPDGTWGTAAANLTLNAAQAPDGTTTAARVDATSGSTDTYINGFIASPSPYSGETMSGSVWLRSVSGTMNINLYIVDNVPGGWGIPASTQVQLTTTWQQFQLSGSAPNNVTMLKLQIGGGGSVTSGQSFMVWNPMLEDAGTAGSSVTNFAPYSQRFSQWNISQGTTTDNSALAPDGTNTAATLTASSNATDNFVVRTIANPAPFSGVAVTGSVWLRVPSGNPQVLLTFYETNSNGAYVTGAQTITLSSNWQRFQVSGTTQSMLNYLDFQIGGAGSFTNGQVIYAWGAQVELASQAGPYVATGATSATQGTSLTNLLPYSQQITGASWGISQASVTNNSDAAPDGSHTAATVNANSNSSDTYVADNVANPALYDQETVTGSVYVRSTSGTMSTKLFLVQVSTAGWNIAASTDVTLNSTWQRFQVTGTLQNGLSALVFQVGGAGTITSGQSYEVWGAQMEVASHAGPYIATTALPVITGSQPTNILPNSQTLNGANWGTANVSVTPNAGTAPDGSNTAATVTANSGSSDSYIVNNVPNPSLYDSETVTASVYLRVPTGASMNLSLFLINVGNQGWGGTGNTVTVTNTWQRFTVSNNNQNGLTQLYFQIGGAGSLTSLQSIQVWGPQLVVGTSAAPYTPTTTTTTVIATGQSGTLVPYGLNEAYAYDSFGNILQNGGFNTTYTANNQMFGYAYDAAGNLLSNGVTPLTWDAESRLTSAAGATYLYDAEGNRVEKQGVGVTDTIYFGGRPIARYAAGQWTDLIYGPTGLLAEVPGTQTGAPVYRVTDHLGTTVGNLTASGSFINPLDYRPFGGVFSGNINDPYLFTGKERDAESGLDYFGARYYASNMGRWMSPDWSPGAVAVPYAKLSDPQSLNLYAYVGNNPFSGVDPDGHRGTLGINNEFAWGDAGTNSVDPVFPGMPASDGMGAYATYDPAAQQNGNVLPDSPANLSPGWQDVTPTPGGKVNPKIPKRYRGPKGSTVEFDPKTPGARPGTHGAKDHWHDVDATGHRVGDYLLPGTQIPGPDGAPDPPAPANTPAPSTQPRSRSPIPLGPFIFNPQWWPDFHMPTLPSCGCSN